MPSWLQKLLGSAAAGSLAAAVLGAAGAFLWEQAEDSGALKERAAWQRVVAEQDVRIADLENQMLGKQINAIEGYVRSRSVAAALAMRSQKEIITYAQTDDGRVRCLPADRVRGVQGYAAALGLAFAPADDPAAADAGD